MRVTLLCRTADQARAIREKRENEKYLPGVALPERLRVEVLGDDDHRFDRADLVFVAVPSVGLPTALDELKRQGIPPRAGIVSMAKGLLPPHGLPPPVALERGLGAERGARGGGPAPAQGEGGRGGG